MISIVDRLIRLWNKKIPQSLSDFIRIAFDLNDSQFKGSKEDNFRHAADLQAERFVEFMSIYDTYKAKLPEIVRKHLSEK